MIKAWVLLNRLLDALLRPLEGLNPLWPLGLGAALMGVAAMLIYKYTTSQAGILDAKEKIKGHFYEVWLYIDDAVVIATAQARIFGQAFRYLAYALPPFAIMVVLFFPLFANFETRYGYRPLRPGEEVMVKLQLKEPFPDWQDKVRLELPPGVSLIGHPVRLVRRVLKSERNPAEKRREYEVSYKLKPLVQGSHALAFTVDGVGFNVPLVCGEDYGRRVPVFAGADLVQALLYPPLASVPAEAQAARIEVAYPAAEFPCLGWNTWWVWPFLLISMIVALGAKVVFKVEV